MSNNKNMPHKPIWPNGAGNESSSSNVSPHEETASAHSVDTAVKGGSSTTLVVISLIIGFGIGWFSAGGDAPKTVEDEMDSDDMTEEVMDDTSEVADDSVEPSDFAVQIEVPAGTVIRVSDQYAGDTVTIDSLELKRSGWVAVYEDRGDGHPGLILGAARFEKGIYTQAPVSLLGTTVSGRTYFVRIHADDGDSDFEFKTTDVPLTDSSGKAFTVSFKTTSVDSPRGN